MSVLGQFWRWLWAPSRPGPAHETWTCPRCHGDVEIESLGWTAKRQGMWLPATEAELVARCGCRTRDAGQANL